MQYFLSVNKILSRSTYSGTVWRANPAYSFHWSFKPMFKPQPIRLAPSSSIQHRPYDFDISIQLLPHPSNNMGKHAFSSQLRQPLVTSQLVNHAQTSRFIFGDLAWFSKTLLTISKANSGLPNITKLQTPITKIP